MPKGEVRGLAKGEERKRSSMSGPDDTIGGTVEPEREHFGCIKTHPCKKINIRKEIESINFIENLNLSECWIFSHPGRRV